MIETTGPHQNLRILLLTYASRGLQQVYMQNLFTAENCDPKLYLTNVVLPVIYLHVGSYTINSKDQARKMGIKCMQL
jgi:hypothetical protein